MNWNNSIFNDDRQPLESWQNRDVDGREIDPSDLMNPQESAQWQRDYADMVIYKTNEEELEHEPDLEQ